MESLTIQPNNKLSVNELVELQIEGFSVMRSAHVGNLRPYNLTLVDAGIPMLLVDHNITGKDKNYFPGMVLSQDTVTQIAADGLISCRARTVTGKFVDEVHVAAISEAFPNSTVFTNTEYLQKNKAVAAEIVNLAVTYFPKEFKRLVLADGTTLAVNDASEYVKKIGIMQLSDDVRAERKAVLIPNMIDIAINFVIEMLATERDEQFHISGPDMIRYITSIHSELSAFYEIITQKASFGNRLPARLLVQLVPAASAVFATTKRYESQLRSVFTGLDESTVALAELGAKRKEFFKSSSRNDSAQRHLFLAKVMAQESIVKQASVTRLKAVPGLFTPSNQRGYITQYDVLKDGGLFVASQNTDLSFQELSTLASQLDTSKIKTLP